MCQRSTRLLTEPSYLFTTTIHDHPEFRRAYSAKSYSPTRTSPPQRSIHRARPASIHATSRTDIPMVDVSDSSELRCERRYEQKKHSRGQMTTRRDDRTADESNHQSRSVSPVPYTRKELTISVASRSWKSAEVDREAMTTSTAALSLHPNGIDQQLSLESSSTCDASPKRGTPLSLSARHKKILRSTFSQLNSGGAFLKLMEQVSRRLEAIYPDIRSIFLTTAFVNSLSRERSSPPLVRTEHDHCKCLVSLFEMIMDNLNDVDSQLNVIRTYGEKHAQMKESGMSGGMIEHFGEIAVAVIASQESIKYNHDAVKAWRLLLAYMTDEMVVGFDRSTRMSERKCSNVSSCPRRSQN